MNKIYKTIIAALIIVSVSSCSNPMKENTADYSDPKRLCEAIGYKQGSEAFYRCVASNKSRENILMQRMAFELQR